MREARFGIRSLVLAAAVSLIAAVAAVAAQTSTVPRSWILPLKTVDRSFPQVTRQAGTGKNTTSSGKPIASRQVIYANRSASQKVTLSIDQYAAKKQASAAFTAAEQKSATVPGFTALPAPRVGQKGSAGTVTQGAETHVGIASVQGSLIVQATIAGYDASDANIAKIVNLTRKQVAAAKRQCSQAQGCSPS